MASTHTERQLGLFVHCASKILEISIEQLPARLPASHKMFTKIDQLTKRIRQKHRHTVRTIAVGNQGPSSRTDQARTSPSLMMNLSRKIGRLYRKIRPQNKTMFPCVLKMQYTKMDDRGMIMF